MSEPKVSQRELAAETAGPFLRDIVFGVHDALLTNIGIITGFAAALEDNRLILLAALIDVFISAFAMAFGTYLSRTSESDYLKGQLALKAHRDLEEVLAQPVTAAVVMWITYVTAGLVPILPFFFSLPPIVAVRYTIILSLVVFFVVGIFKGYVTQTNLWRSGFQFILFGGLAAAIGYFIGSYGQLIAQQ